MAAGLSPVRGQPGVFVIAGTGETIKIEEYRDDAVYDTVDLQSGTTSTAAGTETLFFDNLANKKKRDTNVLQAHKLPQNWELVVMKFGFYAHSYTGNTAATPADLKKVYENATLNIVLNEVPIADGWVLNYQAGVGLAGNTVETGQGVISPGTPSIAAAPTLLVPQRIVTNHYVGATIRFDAFSWTTTAYAQPSLSVGLTAKVLLRGFLKRTVSK